MCVGGWGTAFLPPRSHGALKEFAAQPSVDTPHIDLVPQAHLPIQENPILKTSLELVDRSQENSKPLRAVLPHGEEAGEPQGSSEAAWRTSAWPYPGVPSFMCGPQSLPLKTSLWTSDGPGRAQQGWELKDSVGVKGQEMGECRPTHTQSVGVVAPGRMSPRQAPGAPAPCTHSQRPHLCRASTGTQVVAQLPSKAPAEAWGKLGVQCKALVQPSKL